MTRRILITIILIIVPASLCLSAKPTAAQDNILKRPITFEFSSLVYDQRLLRIALGVSPIQNNLFLPLFRYDAATQTVQPYLARSYTVSPDGLVYTFQLRSDVQWVRYLDGDVRPVRRVTAEDAVAALQPRCLYTDYRSVLYRVIKGCDGKSARASGIKVVDDNTFTVTLIKPAAYLVTLLTEPQNAPIPASVVKSAGTQSWFLPENILTNGSFAVQSTKSVKGQPYTTFVFVRNTLLPKDLQGNGNVEQVIEHIYSDQNVYFTYIQKSGSGLFGVAFGTTSGENEAQNLAKSVKGTAINASPSSFDATQIMIFNPKKAPFDKTEVRRAFSAAIDRSQLLTQGDQVMDRLTPPGIIGAIPSESRDLLGFDPKYAAEQLAEAGYPNCKGLPNITIKIADYQKQLVDKLVDQFNKTLGCDTKLFETTVISFDQWYRTVAGDALARLLPGQVPAPSNAIRPHLWFTNTNAFIPDQMAYVGTYLNCDLSTWGVPCTPAQDLIKKAIAEQDPQTRSKLWNDAEISFFGRAGSFPVAPLTTRSSYVVLASWLKGGAPSFYSLTGFWQGAPHGGVEDSARCTAG